MTPASPLHVKQVAFAQLVAKLIQYIANQGYEVTLGEAYRTPEQAALNAQAGTGIKNSEHTKRLAIDLMLFKDGVYLTASADYKPFGDWWVEQSTPECECAWGGNFTHLQDGNHFSVADGGVE